MTFLKNFLREESGQDMVEYVLILGFVCVAAAALLTGVSTEIKGIWTATDTHVTAANSAATAGS